jgi:nucleoside 2-deoxyribosyltransferase
VSNVAKLTIKGWEKLEASRTRGGIQGRCFVAMAFSEDMTPAYEQGIVPAVVEDCRLPAPIRVDREEHNEQITDRIIAEIRKAQFVIADFTHHRGGVYYEAGFAGGLGRPVIFTCRQDHLPQAHFDTRQYNHIAWNTPPELRQKLANRIQATILV